MDFAVPRRAGALELEDLVVERERFPLWMRADI